MVTVTGDLVELADAGMFDIVLHGCNCKHIMGAGIAGRIAGRWPSVLEVDKREPRLLGQYSVAYVKDKLNAEFMVGNLYTQYYPGRNFLLPALELSLANFLSYLSGIEMLSGRIGIPKIGCGIGGGDWADVKPVLDFRLGSRYDLVYVKYDRNHKVRLDEYTLRRDLASSKHTTWLKSASLYPKSRLDSELKAAEFSDIAKFYQCKIDALTLPEVF